MLAGAAATKPNPAAAAAAAAMQAQGLEMWGINGAGAMAGGGAGLDLTKLTAEQQQQLMANEAFQVGSPCRMPGAVSGRADAALPLLRC